MSPNISHLLITRSNDLSILVHQDHTLPEISYRSLHDAGGDIYKLCQFVQQTLSSSFRLIYLRDECEIVIPHFQAHIQCAREPRLPFTSNIHQSSIQTKHFPSYSRQLIIFEALSDNNCDPPIGYSWLPRRLSDRVSVRCGFHLVKQYLEMYALHGLQIHHHRLREFSKQGWFQRVSKWITKTLSQQPFYEQVQSIKQLRAQPDGAVIFVNVESGKRFFFKETPKYMWNNEQTITCALARYMPEYFETPIAVHVQHRWILMKDLGHSLPCNFFDDKYNIHIAKMVLLKWVNIQKQSSKLVPKLRQAGVIVQDGAWLISQVDQMTRDPEWIKLQKEAPRVESQPADNKSNEYGHRERSNIERLVKEIDTHNVPLTVVHGDLHAANVIIQKGQDVTFFDFGRTSISYPFLDAAMGTLSSCFHLKDMDFYLNEWTSYESLEKLRKLLLLIDEMCDVICSLEAYHAMKNAEQSQLQECRREAALDAVQV